MTLTLSAATLSGTTKTHLYPRSWATMARPTPVLPEVGSTIVPPGRSAPEASAASIIRTAIRSLTEPPGLKYSTLAITWPSRPAVTFRSRTRGVFPIRDTNESCTCTGRLPCLVRVSFGEHLLIEACFVSVSSGCYPRTTTCLRICFPFDGTQLRSGEPTDDPCADRASHRDGRGIRGRRVDRTGRSDLWTTRRGGQAGQKDNSRYGY